MVHHGLFSCKDTTSQVLTNKALTAIGHSYDEQRKQGTMISSFPKAQGPSH